MTKLTASLFCKLNDNTMFTLNSTNIPHSNNRIIQKIKFPVSFAMFKVKWLHFTSLVITRLQIIVDWGKKKFSHYHRKGSSGCEREHNKRHSRRKTVSPSLSQSEFGNVTACHLSFSRREGRGRRKLHCHISLTPSTSPSPEGTAPLVLCGI